MASFNIQVWWYVNGVAIVILGALQLHAKRLPQIVQDALLYGKTRGQRKEGTLMRLVEVPKKWFEHFYAMGVLVNTLLLAFVARSYIGGLEPPMHLMKLINSFKDDASVMTVNTDAMSALLAIAMMMFQVSRRLHECLFISIYSRGTMNLIHYLLGMSFYSTVGLSILSESPDLHNYHIGNPVTAFWKWNHVLGLMLFIFASFKHHIAHLIFANLRKTKDGQVTYGHKIPHGDWFKYVSCPHYFAEILIYISIMMVLGFRHVTFWSVLFFVVTNQLVSGSLTHAWYKKEYRAYPKDRKAIIPFIF